MRKTTIILLPLLAIGCKKGKQPTPVHTTIALAAVHCGSDRWDVKTASDDAVSQVPTLPEPTTVHSLLQRSEPAQWHKTMARQITFDATGGHKPVEGTIWKLTDVELVEWKTEGDHDVHLVVKDKGGPKTRSLMWSFQTRHARERSAPR
jgi:hypothetical protein